MALHAFRDVWRNSFSGSLALTFEVLCLMELLGNLKGGNGWDAVDKFGGVNSAEGESIGRTAGICEAKSTSGCTSKLSISRAG